MFNILIITAQPKKEQRQLNSIYFELLGNGILYSINYDRIMYQRHKVMSSMRIGLHYSKKIPTEQRLLGFPFEVSGLYMIKGANQVCLSHIRNVPVYAITGINWD